MAKKADKKVVNLTGKKVKEEKLVLKEKKAVVVANKDDLKKLNAAIKSKKEQVKAEEKAIGTEKAEPVAKGPNLPKYELSIQVADLFTAGSHLGHKLSKTNPKALEYIYAAKDGVQVWDLPKTYELLEKACNFAYKTVKEGKTILFLGTKRQAKEVVRRVAVECGMPYVTSRWLGGTISNWEQIRRSIRTMNQLKTALEKGKTEEATKKEISLMKKDLVRSEKTLGGLANLDKLFDVVFLVDPGVEKTALREALGKNIPVVALVDTDSNPHCVDYPIPANDDSVKSITILVEEIGKAITLAKKGK